jgi:NADPH-dependent curcumin reductase CurA
MTASREIRLVRRPQGLPTPADFLLVDVQLPEPADGEFLVRNSWMSLDPAMRIRMSGATGYMSPFKLDRPLNGMAVGEVVASRTAEVQPGDQVLHPFGWREYAVVRGGAAGRAAASTRVEVDDATPARWYLGPLGRVGLTAYVGLLDVGELRPHDTVFVSGAAGAVGGLAVQIAKLRGHTVVGSAGSAAKVAFVRDVLGADAAFCYRDGDVRDLLAATAPDGIDLYFDNVGGEHLEAALAALRPQGRVALCGAIATYNAAAPVPGPANLFAAVTKGLTLRGFLVHAYEHRMPEFRSAMRQWLADGTVLYPETVTEGLEHAPEAFIALLRGETTGKALVKLGQLDALGAESGAPVGP